MMLCESEAGVITMPSLCPLCQKPIAIGDWPLCSGPDDPEGKHGHSRPHGGTLLQAIHPLERAVIWRNPQTGEIRTPARNDSDMPDAYRNAGFVREEIMNHQQRRDLEKEGHLMEAAYYDTGSATADREMEDAAGPVLDGSCVGGEEMVSNALTMQDLRQAGLQD